MPLTLFPFVYNQIAYLYIPTSIKIYKSIQVHTKVYEAKLAKLQKSILSGICRQTQIFINKILLATSCQCQQHNKVFFYHNSRNLVDGSSSNLVDVVV